MAYLKRENIRNDRTEESSSHIGHQCRYGIHIGKNHANLSDNVGKSLIDNANKGILESLQCVVSL